MLTFARFFIRCASLLVPRHERSRWREEWLGELNAGADRSSAAWRFALGAPADAWSTRAPMRLLSAVGADTKYAARQLLRRPAHTFAVIACLVIGLVASVATFSVISALFFGDMAGIVGRSALSEIRLSYDSPVDAGGPAKTARVEAGPMSFNDFAAFRIAPRGPGIASIGAEARLRFTVTADHEPVSVRGAFASADFFTTLRTPAAAGRFFTGGDDHPNAAPVAVVTDHFWRTQMDGRSDAIGRGVIAGGISYTVIGIAPPRFHGLQIEVGETESEGVQLWLPLAHLPALPGRPDLDARFIGVLARRNPGVTTAAAGRQLADAAGRIALSNPEKRANAAVSVRSFGFGPDNAPIEVLAILGAVFALPLTVLAIGCMNVANLQLARVAEQSRELAIRLSLGATRAQLLRLLTAETLARVLVAVAISMVAISVIVSWVQPLLPVLITLDWRVLAFAIVLAIGVAVATGMMPAWLVLRGRAAGLLKQSAQSGGLGHARLRGGLVVAQVALSLGLLVLTGLFARTVQVIAGSAPTALREQMVADFDLGELGLSPAEASRVAQAISARVAADPRIRHAAVGSGDSVEFGLPADPRDRYESAVLMSATQSWIDVMGLDVLTGRRLADSDDPSAAVLSLRAAELIAPGASPLGMVIRVTSASTERQVRVVGVVADSRTGPSASRPTPVVYVRFPNEMKRYFTLRVRASDRDAIGDALRPLISQVDDRITWTSLRRGDGPFEQDSSEMGYVAMAIGAGGLVALVLSATGLYAVMSYVVTLRRREIGVRLAIGAPPARILSLMMRQSMRLVLAGVVFGLLLAVPLAFWLRAAVVIEANPADPMVFLPTTLLLTMVGAIAAAAPALRASRVDPISTLRQD